MDEMIEIEKVVFKEEDGRVFEIKIGLKLPVSYIESLCREFLDNLYHLETKPEFIVK